MIEVIPISALKDNYIWMLKKQNIPKVVIVDPGEAAPVIRTLQHSKLQLAAILITHHHWDHTNGIEELLNYQSVPVYASAREQVAFCTDPLQDLDRIHISELNLDLQVIAIPGHTLGHIAFYGNEMLYTGDTLFAAGCGRVFEGTMEQMYNSLQKLTNFPEATQVYCGHEYTVANLQFARLADPKNEDVAERLEQELINRAQNRPTLPATLAIEFTTNPFLRCHLSGVKDSAEAYSGKSLNSPLEVFSVIRQWKDKI